MDAQVARACQAVWAVSPRMESEWHTSFIPMHSSIWPDPCNLSLPNETRDTHLRVKKVSYLLFGASVSFGNGLLTGMSNKHSLFPCQIQYGNDIQLYQLEILKQQRYSTISHLSICHGRIYAFRNCRFMSVLEA
ncbi:uncharacterized protein BDR25DRAFT_348077 [Lindgomyces ingoldianus]|uniref:Uncharacterized protein n=1 Tax=Lindgomyces ingoldianus TaxID=673940 RepID=A0ACB6RER7_9PLEO|nr:uncharacterized protein BDR25DRAFT_348077 [Lindgomyces ingoldianus]KAF2477759.1 hypothetical protein BDR25DRAFT_348077 [Lindgomyces ingoldianus]